MAMEAFEVFGVLRLDTTEYDRDLDKSVAKGTMIGNMASNVAMMGVRALEGAGRGILQFGQDSINAATSFESAFIGVRKTVDATEEEYAELSDWIMEASTRMASSKEDIAATMEIAGQLGVSGTEGLKKFTETMIMLGDTTNLNAEEAAGALARFGNIAGLQAEDMDRIGSVIVDLGNNFATTEADIVEMSTRLASAGTIAGLSAQDILALSTAMSSVGIKAEAGGTAMAQTIAKMSKAVDSGGEDLEKFAAVAGMTSEEFAATWKGEPIEAIQAFIGGLQNINEADESVIMTLEDLGLKGIRQTNMLQALALSSEMLGGAVDMANNAYEENVALTNEATLRYGTTESAALQAAEGFKNLKVAIGEELLPVYGELMSFSQGATASLTESLKSGGIEEALGNVGTILVDAVMKIQEKLPQIAEAGLNLVRQLAQALIDNKDTIIEGAYTVIETLVMTFDELLPMLTEVAIQLILALANGITKVNQNLVQVTIHTLMLIIETIVQHLPEILESGVQIVLSLVDGILNALPTLLSEAPVIIAELVNALIVAAPQLTIAAVQLIFALITGLINCLPELGAVAGNLVISLADAFVNRGLPAITQAGENLIAGLGDGIEARFSNLLSRVKTLATRLVSVVKNIFGIHSPSKVFAEIGEFLGLGLEQGWDNEAGNVEDSITSSLGGIMSSAGSLGSIDLNTVGTVSVEGAEQGNIVIPVYIGDQMLDEIVVNANRQVMYRNGGR